MFRGAGAERFSRRLGVILTQGGRLQSRCVAGPLAVLCFSALTGCEGSDEVRQSAQQPATSPEPSPPAAPPLPSHEILAQEAIPGVKRSVDVRIQAPIEEEELRRLALAVKSADSRSYPRTFITYYLPDMKIGSGAWATTYFDPDLQVKILGLSKAAYSEVVEPKQQVGKADGRVIVGQWLDQYSSSRVTVFTKGKKTFMARQFGGGGSEMVTEFRRTKTKKGTRLDPLERSSTGDRYLIASDGWLESWDNDGLISRARPIP